jgi:hypothetical protein
MEERMVKIMHNLKVAQDMKKIYVDKNKTYIEFKGGEHVFLKVKAKRSSLILGDQLYEKNRGRPAFQKAWDDKKKGKMDQRKKGFKFPFIKISSQAY